MKNKLLQIFIISVLAFFFSFSANGQTPTGICTVLQQPCNGDGVLVTTITSGMTLPLTFEYYYFNDVTRHTVNAMSDTLYNIQLSFNIVFISDDYGHFFYLQTGLQGPFEVNFSSINPECPDTMASVEVYINNSTINSVEWYQGTDTNGTFLGSGNPFFVSINNDITILTTDTAGCTFIYTPDVSSDSLIYQIPPFDLYATINPANCSNGSIIVDSIAGGIPPYYYQWDNGLNTSQVSNLITGYYFLTITDSAGCNKRYYFEVPQSVNIAVNCVTSYPSCTNNNGSSMAFASGGVSPYIYHWSNGINGQQTTGLLGNHNYYVDVIDSDGCRGNKWIYVTITTPITVTYSSDPSSCLSPTGSITLDIQNGTPPYTTEWNTFPPQTGITATNLSPGNYSFTVTDAVGCINTGVGTVYCESIIDGYIISSNILCSVTDGNLQAIVYNGTNPPFSYNWSNGQTGANCNVSQPGTYTCTITDNLGCTKTVCKYVGYGSLINIILTPSPTSCIFTADGSISASVTGGTPPYTFSWSPTGGIGSVASGLSYGGYWCHVTDANGCHDSKYIYLDYDHNNDSCYCTITGRVYIDLNSNCTYDSGEECVQNIMMHCTGFGYAFTDTAGVYSFIVPTGSYEIREIVQSIYPLSPCQINPVNVSVTASPGCINEINIANRLNPLHDIMIYATSFHPAIPGYEYIQQFYIKNSGTIAESDILFGHKDDGQLNEYNIYPSVLSQPSIVAEPEWYRNHSGTISLLPGEWETILFYYNVPVNIPLGTTVNLYDTVAYAPPITNWLGDYSPWNNIFDTTIVIVGSYDPNFKEVYPAGYAPQGFISLDDSILTYTIHFQNTGSYYAQNIYIIDTIDTNHEVSSMQILFSSHDCNVSVSETGIVRFSFNDINLPYNNSYGEILSSGFVSYTIKTKPNLSPGTVMGNGAAIFFDYNQPIFTNTVVNTIEWPEWIQTHKANKLSVFPNPAENMLYIKSDISITRAVIYDCSGRIVSEKLYDLENNFQNIQVGHLAGGLYLLGCEYSDHSTGYVRFNKE